MSDAAKRVLLVDDDRFVRECIGAILEHIGYQVRTASSVDEALKEAPVWSPELVILDVDLGAGGDGITCCRRMREMEGFARTPIVMMTGLASRELVIQAAQAGANGYVLKTTLNIADFTDRLNRILQGPAPTPDSAPDAPPVPAVPAGQDPAPAGPPPDQEGERRIAKIHEPRALPFLATELGKLALSSGATTEDMVNVIKRDPAICAVVLRTVNSSFYRARGKTLSLERAVVGLGFGGLRTLAGSLEKFEDLLDSPESAGFALGYWQHSLACAILARRFAAGGGAEEAETAFLVGLLHDLGRPLLREAFPEFYGEVLRDAAAGVPLREAEQRRLGTDHLEAVCRTLTAWKIPPELVQAIGAHHDSWDQLRRRNLECFRPAAAVAVAERVLTGLAAGWPDDDRIEEVPDDLAALLELRQPELERMLADVYNDLDDFCAVFYLHMREDQALPPLTAQAPPESPSRKAFWVRAAEPRVDTVALALRQSDFAVRSGTTPEQAAEPRPDLVLASAEFVKDVPERLESLRRILHSLGEPAPRALFLAPESALSGLVPPPGIALVNRPLRVTPLLAALA